MHLTRLQPVTMSYNHVWTKYLVNIVSPKVLNSVIDTISKDVSMNLNPIPIS